MEMTLPWLRVLPGDVCFHKNRPNQLQRGLDCLRPHNPARGERRHASAKKAELEEDILFGSVVGDAAVQGDAIAELSVVAVFFVFALGVPAVLSQSRRSAPLAQASGSLHQPHGLGQT